MNAMLPTEYRDLALDSSNEMMAYDSRWILGRYSEAAWHMLQAGLARDRMGAIALAAGEFVSAAEDWLSAAACFYLATDLARMQAAFERVRKLDQEGEIPPKHHDIHAALREREEQIKALEQKLSQFDQDYSHAVGLLRSANDAGDFLLRWVREVPGLPKLHVLLAIQLNRLGQLPLAIEHLEWAEKFDPGNAQLGALRVRFLHATGETHKAIQLGRETLARHPEMIHLRVYLAQIIAARAGAGGPDWEEAIGLLTPLANTHSDDVEMRTLALGMAATLRHGLGHDAEHHHLLQRFDQLAQAIQSPGGKGMVSEVRRLLPKSFRNPGPTEQALAEER